MIIMTSETALVRNVNVILIRGDAVLFEITLGITYKHKVEMQNTLVQCSTKLLPLDAILQAAVKPPSLQGTSGPPRVLLEVGWHLVCNCSWKASRKEENFRLDASIPIPQ